MTTTRRVFVYDASNGETYQVGGGMVRPRLVGVSILTDREGCPDISDGRGFLKSSSLGATPSDVRSASEYGNRNN